MTGLLAMAASWSALHARSPAVRNWEPPTLDEQRRGPLFFRVGGPVDADVGVVLLHGLVATGDVFGATAARLARHHRVVVPDLLGFGRSLDETGEDFTTVAHLEALDDVIGTELAGKRLHVGAHSMGSALALRWAVQHVGQVDRVVCVGVPAWPDPAAARLALGRTGPMAKALLLDERLAQALCRFSCRHRDLAGLLSAALAPRWPIPIARQASLHTWPAYIQALEEQVIACPWDDLLDQLARADVDVHFVQGDQDPTGDIEFLRALAATHRFDLTSVEGDHTLPAAEPGLLTGLLR